MKLSRRQIARMHHISHTKLYDTMKLRAIAESRGFVEELSSRVQAGEKQSVVMADLMPDVLEYRKIKQQINQYRSTTRWLLRNGFDPEDLIQFINDEV